MIKEQSELKTEQMISNQFGDHYLYSVNRNNFLNIDYHSLFVKEFSNTFDGKDTLFIILGTDSGLMVKELEQQPPKQGSAYVFIEFDEITEATKNNYNTNKTSRIIVTNIDNWETDTQKIGLDIYLMINRVQVQKSFAAQYDYIGQYLNTAKYLEERISHLKWQYQTQIGSKNFVQTQLANLAENHTPALCLKNSFQNKSCLILAGGPSLDKYIHWIEQNQEHYIVIAVSRIARRLLDTKIIPDIFVSVDPLEVNFGVSKEIYNYEENALFVHQYHVSPKLLSNWLGQNLYLGSRFPWETPLNPPNLTGIGPTVTNTAILLALNMGFKEQILFGVDLCYSPEGYTHAKGSLEFDEGPEINQITQTVTTNDGTIAETNSAYFEAISTIADLASIARQSSIEIINPSPDAVAIENVTYTQLENIKIPEDNCHIQQIQLQQKSIQEQINYYHDIIKELNKAEVKIQKIEKLAKSGLEYNQKLFVNQTPEKNYKFKLKMDKVEKELNNNKLVNFTDLAKKFGANELLYFLKPDNEQKWSNEDIEKSAQTYYKALLTGAKDLYKHIFTARNRLEVRLIEKGVIFNDHNLFKRHYELTQFTTLTLSSEKKKKINILNPENQQYYLTNTDQEYLYALNLWTFIIFLAYDRSFRRFSLLKNHNPTLSNLNDNIVFNGKSYAEIKASIDEEIKLYSKIRTRHTKKDKLEGLENKLYNLFQHQDKTRIKHIINALINLKHKGNEDFIHLAQGYLYELENQPDKAVNEYQQAADDRTIESALKQIVNIALQKNDLENAHTGIQLLTKISDEYLPQLAELYKITKNYKAAIDTYTEYLDSNPRDIATLLKLGEIYQSQDVSDAALFVYQAILEINPDNSTAQKNLTQLKADNVH